MTLSIQPILVLGMHRSGTSALARAIGLLGASLGPPDGLDRNWEQIILRRLNDDVLRLLDSDWDAPAQFPPGWETESRFAPLGRAGVCIARDLETEPAWVLKDPRMCLTMPFWRGDVGLEPAVVFIHRNPLEVSASLHRRNPRMQLGGSPALALWERYNCDALANIGGLRTVILSYDELLDDPLQSCELIRGALDSWELQPAQAATSELDAARRHHMTDRSDPTNALSPGLKRTLSTLEDLRGIHEKFDAKAAPPLSAESRDVLEWRFQKRRFRQAGRQLKSSAATMLGHASRVGRRRLRAPADRSTED